MIEEQGSLDATSFGQAAHHVVQQVGLSRQHGGAKTVDHGPAGPVRHFDQAIDLPLALERVEHNEKRRADQQQGDDDSRGQADGQTVPVGDRSIEPSSHSPILQEALSKCQAAVCQACQGEACIAHSVSITKVG